MHDFSPRSARGPRTWSVPIVALALVLAACSGAAAPAGSAGPGDAASPTAAQTGAEAPPTSGESPGAGESLAPGASPDAGGVVLTQGWATADLTDVRDGTTFRIADLVTGNRVVFIETMAIWCSNCRSQQRDVVKALANLNPERVTWIGVDVDGSESASALAEYSRSLGFDWAYVVGSADFLRALADDFGAQVLSPPSTPIIVVGTNGTVTLTEFGHKSVDRILELATSNGA
ncbi:MAG: redoxin domain-containing protein [Chloroflexota bacterium]